eukprot:8059248-Pyramimonas_sp.AAC.1
MQLYPMSWAQSQIERRMLARVFRAPFSMFRRSDLFQLRSFGRPQPVSALALSAGAMMRADLLARSIWQ